MIRQAWRQMLGLAAVACLAMPAWGVVTFTNVGPGDTFSNACSVIHLQQWVAVPFTATTTGPLTSIRLPIFNGNTTPTENLIITLRAPGPDANGAVLEQWTRTPAQLTTFNATLQTLTSVAQPLLTAGQTYWLRAQSIQPNTDPQFLWCFNTTGDTLNSVSFNQAATWIDNPTAPALALEVNVDVLLPISFQVRYASNLSVGDSVINLTNNGASSTGIDMAAMGLPQTGNLCVHVYAYTPDEQLASCCSGFVTPNGLNSLSVRNDLASNPLTPVIPSSMVIKLLAATPDAGNACNAAKPGVLLDGLQAWGTTLHQLPVTAGTPATTYGVTETPFSNARLSVTEFQRMTTLCGFIRANGSGYGICKSCKLGGLGAASK